MRMFDELNVNRKSVDYATYFGEMDISEKEKEERIELAKELEVLFLFLFIAYDKNRASKIKDALIEKYKKIATEFIDAKQETSYIAEYSKKIIDETIRVTNENIDDPYYTSWDRAILISENESNVIGSYRQQLQAVKSGKKNKTWITMNDDKVRHTHREIEGLTIPIFEPFQVGDSKMMFPKDSSLGASAEEIVNCRCVAKYS